MVTNSLTITTESRYREPRSLRPPLPPHVLTTHGWQHQSPAHKARQLAKASTDVELSAVSSPTGAVPSDDRALRCHDHRSKSTASAEAHTASSYDTVPWGLRSLAQPPTIKWPFLNSTSSPAESSRGSSAHSANGMMFEVVDTPPRLPSAALLKANEQLRILSSTIKTPQESPSTGTATSREEAAKLPATLEHEAQRTLCASDDLATVRSRHIAYPMAEQRYSKPLSDAPVTPQGSKPAPGPRYHSQCPKVRTSVLISPSEPKVPQSPSPTHQAPALGNKTSISSIANLPPPLPTPGLPSPLWSTETTSERRKTFLLSRSTWSDTTESRRLRAVDTGEAAAQNDREIHRMLLLLAYPLAYFVLWLPWMVNEFMEACGSVAGDPIAMAALVGLPQYLGLVHATVFAVNEVLMNKRRARGGSSDGASG